MVFKRTVPAPEDSSTSNILVIDKKRKEAIIIEIGITSQDCLKTVETEKLHKYDSLAGEISMLHRCSARIVPYVVT